LEERGSPVTITSVITNLRSHRGSITSGDDLRRAVAKCLARLRPTSGAGSLYLYINQSSSPLESGKPDVAYRLSTWCRTARAAHCFDCDSHFGPETQWFTRSRRPWKLVCVEKAAAITIQAQTPHETPSRSGENTAPNETGARPSQRQPYSCRGGPCQAKSWDCMSFSQTKQSRGRLDTGFPRKNNPDRPSWIAKSASVCTALRSYAWQHADDQTRQLAKREECV
jgi:hypothetical protein